MSGRRRPYQAGRPGLLRPRGREAANDSRERGNGRHPFNPNPQRQGENSTALGEGDPHNILHETPTIPDHGDVGDITYAPMWDVHLAEWTPSAIANGDQVGLQSTDEVFARLGTDDLSQVPSDSKAVGAVTSCEMSAQECQAGLITGPGGARFGPSGFVVNCPLISIDIS